MILAGILRSLRLFLLGRTKSRSESSSSPTKSSGAGGQSVPRAVRGRSKGSEVPADEPKATDKGGDGVFPTLTDVEDDLMIEERERDGRWPA